MPEAHIHIVAFIGSVRPGNFTAKALRVAVAEYDTYDRVDVEVIDPADYELALPGTAKSSAVADELQAKVRAATGVILATPEYHGSYSSVIKLVIEHLGFPSTLATKPVAIIGVAAGAIGAIKSTEHLRSVCSHVGAIVLPGAVSIAGVQQQFDAEGRALDGAMEKRLRGAARGLVDYIEQNICPRMALEQMVREG